MTASFWKAVSELTAMRDKIPHERRDLSKQSLPFKTTTAERLELDGIAAMMRCAGVDSSLVTEARNIAQFCQGVYDLMFLWSESASPEERADALSDLRTAVIDWGAEPIIS